MPKGRNSVDSVIAAALRPQESEAMNSDLSTAKYMKKLDQKNVTAWLILEQGCTWKYLEYKQEQVSILISGIRDFVTRHPA